MTSNSLSRNILAVSFVFLLLGLTGVETAAAAGTLQLQGAWQVPSTGRTLSVVIVRNPSVPDAAVNDFVTAIMSTGTVAVLVNGALETQYVGWTGAFQNTNVNGGPIPLSFAISVTQKAGATGDITITFKEGRFCITYGSTDLTKSGGYIVSAKITVTSSCVERFLNSDGRQTLARILFGWAVGLGVSNDPNDLMYRSLNAIKYISQCDLKGINTVYSDPSATSVSCP